MSWTSEQTFSFIAMVKDQLDLWNTKNKNKTLVDAAWHHIANQMKTPTTELKAKLNQLISTYSNITAHMTVDDAAPIWEYYSAMDGLIKDVDFKQIVKYAEDNSALDDLHSDDVANDNMTPHTSGSVPWTNSMDNAMDHNINNAEDDNISNARDNSKKKPQVVLPDDSDQEDSDSSDEEQPDETGKSRKRKSDSDSDYDQDNTKLIAKALGMFTSLLTEKLDTKTEEVTAYSQIIAMKLRSLSPMRRKKLMYDIDGLLLRKSIELGIGVAEPEQNGKTDRNFDIESSSEDDNDIKEDPEFKNENEDMEIHENPVGWPS